MTAWKRLAGLLGAIFVAGMLLSLSGGPSMRYMVSPGALFQVFAMTLGLGLFTYNRKRLFGSFRELFSNQVSQRDPHHKRMLSQLALYALLSGIVLALAQILLESFRTSERIDQIGSNPVALRAPFTILLYAVLTALGFWLISGPKASQEDSNETEAIPFYRQFAMGASLLLCMMIGLVCLLVVGMTKDSMRQNSDEDGHGEPSARAFEEEVHGLYRGQDGLWRPLKSEPSHSPRPEERTTCAQAVSPVSHSVIPPAVMPCPDEIPLRWELSLNDRPLDQDRISPMLSEPSPTHID